MPPKKPSKKDLNKELKKKNMAAAMDIIAGLKEDSQNQTTTTSSASTSSKLPGRIDSGSTRSSEATSIKKPTSKRTTEKKKTSDSNRIDKLKPRSEKARTSKITRGRVSGPDVTVAKSSNDGKTKMPQASTSREPHSYASSVAKARKTSDAKYQYAIDCNKVADSIDVNDLKAFLEKNLKVNGEKNNLKSCVTIRCEGEKVVIDSKTFLPKKCLRFLSKKYLKRNWNIRVVSKNVHSYEYKYVGTL